MKILIFSWRGPKHPLAGGAEIVTHEHAKAWVKAGHEVTLFTSFYSGAKNSDVIDGVKIIREGHQILSVQFAAFKWYLFQRKEKFDLVIDHFHGLPFFTPLFVKSKILGFIHEVAKEVWQFNSLPRPYSYFPAGLGRIFEPFIFLMYRKIPFMTVSASTKQDLISWGIPKEKISVIHSGVTRLKNRLAHKKEKHKTLIFLGALSKDKGIEDALRVFSLLHKKESDYKLWVAGVAESNYLNKIQNLCQQLKIEKDVTFFGFVSEERKFELLSKAHLLISTSIREGWGLVVIEAATVGTPTVAFDASGLRDSIKNGQTGFLCQERDVSQLADLIDQIYKDQDKLNQISKNAIIWSKKFTWEGSTQQSLKLISSLAG